MTEKEFGEIFRRLVAGVGRAFSEDQWEAWFFALEDLSAEQFAAGVKRWMQSVDSGFPSIAAVRSMSIESTAGVLPDAAQAWQSVIKAISRFGHARPLEALHSMGPLTAAVVGGVVGFRRLCDCPSADMSIQSAQFRRAFEAAAGRVDEQRKLSADVRPVSAIESRQRRINSPAAVLAKRLTCAEGIDYDGSSDG